ncbi:hypothetical protein [Mangrovibacterium diazotrophicum]|uniref:Uncharacterized protein n=1 Tax=Mangrovibacterium diazotrophicum TaxID=1261403 RepID=A0A419W348_9BACT|nr:hypothetical protein [Mangrovibacterium diazotrophicum]RKD89854.1 hypothetical protein BC643_0187 [Mangrovibacterium diazotrophicum]
MNFVNPYLEIYYSPEHLWENYTLPFYKEIFWLFLKNLDNRLKGSRRRLNIVFLDSESATGILRFGSISENRVYLNSEDFERLDENSKRAVLLEIVFDSFMKLASENDWDKDIIQDAYQKSISGNLQFSYQTDFMSHRSHQARGCIELSLFGSAATLTAKVETTTPEEVLSIDLLTINEQIISRDKKIKEFGWYDESRFGLKFLNGELWILANIENRQSETIINPKKRTRANIELFLNSLYY